MSTPRPFFAYPSVMDDEPEVSEAGAAAAGGGLEGEGAEEAGLAAGERDPVPPIESRFLYVVVAAQRAKQLRRGVLPRLEELADVVEPDGTLPSDCKIKLERIGMQEVDRGKIRYDLPDESEED